jgi:hypothetical protein
VGVNVLVAVIVADLLGRRKVVLVSDGVTVAVGMTAVFVGSGVFVQVGGNTGGVSVAVGNSRAFGTKTGRNASGNT